MRHIEIEAAQPILEELLDEVEQGATIMLTRNGVAVVRIVPYRTGLPPDLDPPARS
jgi:prevent-host-death family protein